MWRLIGHEKHQRHYGVTFPPPTSNYRSADTRVATSGSRNDRSLSHQRPRGQIVSVRSFSFWRKGVSRGSRSADRLFTVRLCPSEGNRLREKIIKTGLNSDPLQVGLVVRDRRSIREQEKLPLLPRHGAPRENIPITGDCVYGIIHSVPNFRVRQTIEYEMIGRLGETKAAALADPPRRR